MGHFGWHAGGLVSEDQLPAPDELAAELAEMLRPGMTTQQLRGKSTLLSLALVAAKSASDEPTDLAAAAQTVISEAAASVDGTTTGAASILLGIAPGTRGSLLKDRRRWAAEELHVSAEHVRKERAPLLIEAMADELYAADSIFRLRHKHRTEPERSPEKSGLGINWLEQHRSYRRIWTPLEGMRNDLYVLLRYLQDEQENRDAISDRLVNITWQWARFCAGLEKFIEEEGGLWLLADMESEIAAADAIYRVQFYAPLGETDNSWLRTLLAETPHQELDGFGDRLVAEGERRRELVGVWMAWVRACNGDPEADDPNCELHAWFETADQFIRLIDEDWYRVADFYRRSSPYLGQIINTFQAG